MRLQWALYCLFVWRSYAIQRDCGLYTLNFSIHVIGGNQAVEIELLQPERCKSGSSITGQINLAVSIGSKYY